MDKYVKNLDFCLDFVQYDEYEDNGKLCMWGRGAILMEHPVLY